MTTRELAQRSGMAPSTVNAVELGVRLPAEGGIPSRMRAAYLNDDEVRELAAVAARRRGPAQESL